MSDGPRRFAVTPLRLGVGLCLAAPWLPGSAGPGDSFVALGLSGLLLPALGCLAASGSARWWRAGLAAAAAWWLSFAAQASFGVRPLSPDPAWLGLLAFWGGLALAGAGSGSRVARTRGPAGGLGLALGWTALGALLIALPGRAERAPTGAADPVGWAQGTPERAAHLVDASPATWAFEIAGVDWMRHPAVYEPAGTDWFSGSRAPWSAGLAGPLALVLGCVFGGCCAGFRGGRETRARRSG